MLKPDFEWKGQWYFLTETLAEVLGCSPSLMTIWCRNGQIKAERFEGYRWIIPVSSVLDSDGNWVWLPPHWSALSDHIINRRVRKLILNGLENKQK